MSWQPLAPKQQSPMTEIFGPKEWVEIGGSTSKMRRITLEAVARANEKPIDELFTLLRKGELDPYSVADKMVRMQLGEGLARSYVEQQRIWIGHFYRFAEIQYKEDLFKLRVTRVPHLTESEPGSLSETELRILFKILEPEWQGLMDFCISTGCRPGEAFSTKTRDLGLSKNPVWVRFSAGRTKTNKNRYSFLSTEATRLIKPVLGKEDEPLFDFVRAGGSFRNLLQARLIKAGLTKPIKVGENDQITKWTVHAHTFRSINKAICNRAGFDPYWTEKLQGHETVQGHYASYEEMAESWLLKVDPKMKFIL